MTQPSVALGRIVDRSLIENGGRVAAWFALAALVFGIAAASPTTTGYATTAAIYVLVGLSLNIVLGYVGQLSLGHQALVGTGALFAAYLSKSAGLPFPVDVVVGGAAGAVLALLIGFVALRIRGLYLALVTLVIGITLQGSLFEVPALTGGGAGESANRPNFLLSNGRFYLVCVAVCLVAFYVDSRLERSKAGRALLTIKEDERVASSFGIDVMGYKLLAFVISGVLAGVAGALFAFSSQQFNGNDFSFQLALTFVLMTVVGGAGSRVGVAVGSVIFALLHTVVAHAGPFVSFANLFPTSLSANIQQFGPDLIGAFLLLLTLAFNPGGLAQQLAPVVRWMRGGRFRMPAQSVSMRATSSGRP
ncbi:MAG: branched-chain amino acid ABC transporter permease [Acidimicrobiales bacterium]